MGNCKVEIIIIQYNALQKLINFKNKLYLLIGPKLKYKGIDR